MKGSKVISQGKRVRLISWTYKDMVHYGIEALADGQMLQVFSPTKEMKGWALRQGALQRFKEMDSVEAGRPLSDFYSVVQDIDSITSQHFLVWWNKSRGRYSFGKVTSKSEYLVFYVSPDNDPGFFNKSSLQEKIDLGVVWVVDSSQIPSEVVWRE